MIRPKRLDLWDGHVIVFWYHGSRDDWRGSHEQKAAQTLEGLCGSRIAVRVGVQGEGRNYWCVYGVGSEWQSLRTAVPGGRGGTVGLLYASGVCNYCGRCLTASSCPTRRRNKDWPDRSYCHPPWPLGITRKVWRPFGWMCDAAEYCILQSRVLYYFAVLVDATGAEMN